MYFLKIRVFFIKSQVFFEDSCIFYKESCILKVLKSRVFFYENVHQVGSCAHINTHTYEHTHIYTHRLRPRAVGTQSECTCPSGKLFFNAVKCTYTHKCTHTHTHTNTHTYIRTHTHIRTHRLRPRAVATQSK
jgi:hypothetical protein